MLQELKNLFESHIRLYNQQLNLFKLEFKLAISSLKWFIICMLTTVIIGLSAWITFIVFLGLLLYTLFANALVVVGFLLVFQLVLVCVFVYLNRYLRRLMSFEKSIAHLQSKEMVSGLNKDEAC